MASLLDCEQWFAASSDERAETTAAAARVLGAEWAVEAGPNTLGAALRHAPTGVLFSVVPGGTTIMGLAPSELQLLDLYLGRRKHVIAQVQGVQQYARPLCEVRVKPFLCGYRLLDKREVDRCLPDGGSDAVGAVHRDQALSAANNAGFRLPSDAELEWIARQGRQAPFVLDCVFEAPEEDQEHVLITNQPICPRFGIADLFETQWAADDWFDSHESRPSTGEARTGGGPQGVRRFEEFYFEAVGRESVISQLSARRDPGRGWRARVRLALDIPANV